MRQLPPLILSRAAPFGSKDIPCVLVLLAITTITWLPRLKGPIDLRWDGAAYFILGTSLASGEGYQYLNEPGEVAVIAFPPLLPLFVSAHQWALQSSDPVLVGSALRGSYVTLSLLYTVVTFAFLRTFFSPAVAFAGSVLVVLNMGTIWLSDRLYADLPFAIATTASLLLLTWRTKSEFAVWLVATATFLLRTAGITLLLAWAADAVFAKDRRSVVRRAALAAIPLLAWQAYVYSVESSGAYANPPYAYARADYALYNVSYKRNMLLRDPTRPELGRAAFTELPQRIISNLGTAPLHLGEAVSLLEREFANLIENAKPHTIGRFIPWRIIPIALFVLGFFVLLGAILFGLTKYKVLSLVIALYLFFLALLPTDYHWPRYLAGIAPIVVACFIFALVFVSSQLNHVSGSLRRAVPGMVYCTALILQSINVYWYYSFDLRTIQHRWGESDVVYRMFTYDEAFSAFDEGIDWIARNADPDDVIVSSMPHWVSVRTGRPAIMPPFESAPQKASELMASA